MTRDKNIPTHGANPRYLYDYYGIDFVDNYIDFSTNTNVLEHGVTLKVQDSYVEKYPDPESKSLRAILSQKLDVEPDNLLITNGANEAIYLLAAILAGKNIAILQPAYSEYEKAFSAYGCRIEYIDDSQVKKQEYDAIILSNPSNPSGRLFNLEDLIGSLGHTLLLVDEPYMIKLLKLEDFLEETKSFYQEEKKFCFYQLKKLGFELVDSQTNFYLLKLWAQDDKIISFLLKEGLVVRHTKNFPGLNGRYIRLAIKSRQENQELITKLKLCKKVIS